MTTLTLVRAVAKGFHRPEATVALAIRRLRDDGELDEGASGRGGAPVSARDASRLMMGLCSGHQIKDLGPAVRSIRGLPLTDITPKPERLRRRSDGHPDVRRVALDMYEKPGLTFGRMLEDAIRSAARGRLLPVVHELDTLSPPTASGRQRRVSTSDLLQLNAEESQIFRVQIGSTLDKDQKPFAVIHFGIKRLFLFSFIFDPGENTVSPAGDHLILPRNPGLNFVGGFDVDAIRAAAVVLRE